MARLLLMGKKQRLALCLCGYVVMAMRYVSRILGSQAQVLGEALGFQSYSGSSPTNE